MRSILADQNQIDEKFCTVNEYIYPRILYIQSYLRVCMNIFSSVATLYYSGCPSVSFCKEKPNHYNKCLYILKFDNNKF